MNILEQAMQHINKQEIDEALQLLDKALETASPETAFAIAELYSQLGFLEQAADILESLLTQFPGESELIAMLGDIYVELGQDDKALNLVGEAEVDDPDDPQYLQLMLQQADLYQSQGLYEVAEQKLLQAKQHHPKELILDFALGELLFSLGDYGRAVHFFKNVLAESTAFAGVQIAERLAEALAALGNYEEALQYYQQSESDDADYLFKYGFTAYRAERTDIAVQTWKKLLELDPEYLTAYAYLAKAYAAENFLEEAYATTKAGIEKDAFQKEIFFEAGSLAYQLGFAKESETYLREAVVLDADYKEAVLLLVKLLKENADSEAIVDLLETIKEQGAEDALYDWELARAFSELELYKKALKYYQSAYTFLKQDSEFLKEYGYFLMEEGLAKEAVDVLAAYVALEPLDIETASYVERLAEADRS